MARSRLVLPLAVAACASVSAAQVAPAFERAHGGNGYAVHGAAEHATGGLLVSGAIESLSPDFPSPTYIPRTPFLLKLDAAGELVWQRTIGVGFDQYVDTVLADSDASGRVVLAFPVANVQLRGYAADGAPTFSTGIVGDLLPNGLRCAPWGDFTVVLRVAGPAVVVAGFDAAGTSRFVTAPLAPLSGLPAVAIAESGRVATHTTTTLHVVEPDGTSGWSAPLAFTPRSMAFGPSGELALAGHDGTNPIVRVHEPGGAVRFTRTDPQSAPGGWGDVTVDRFGRIATTGGIGGGDAIDAIVALFGADGSTGFVRTWSGPAGFVDAFARVLVTDSGDVVAAGRTDLNSSSQYWTNQRRLLVVAFDPAGVERWRHVDAESGTNTETCVRLVEAQDGLIVTAGTRLAQNFVNPGYRALGAHVLGLRRQSIGLCYGDAQSAACPCGNASAPGEQRGCANSSGNAARLVDAGVASLSNDTLTLTVDGTTPNAPGLYFQGSIAQSPVAFGDGLRCASGTLLRLYTKQAQLGTSSAPAPADPRISARAAAAGDVLAPGTSRVYQVSYRDVNAAFCPSPAGAAQNASSALLVTWGP